MKFFGLPLIVLAAGGFLLISSPAWSAGNQPSSPPAIGQSSAATVEKARALIEKGRHTEALVLLRPLVERRTVDKDVLFLIGLAAIGASQRPGLSEEARDTLLDAAIPALRRLLVNEPGLVRVRLELARAFFLKGEDTLATRHFEQVLAGEPPAPVVLNVNRFLTQMRARKRWSVRVGVALAPDSNVGASSRGANDLARYPARAASIYPQRRQRAQIRCWHLGLGRRGIPVPAGGSLAAARGRRHLAPRVPLGRVRPNDRFGPCGPALADRPRQRGELAGERAPALALGRGGVSRPRDPRRGAAPAQPADDGEPQRFPARTPLRRTHASRRAAHRYLGGRRLGGDADGAYRRGGGLGEPEDGTRARAPYAALGAARRHGAPSLGLPP